MAAYNSFKKILDFAGLDVKKFAMHSPRVGAATDAYKNGVPGYIIDKRGRWKSASMKKRYCRPGVNDWLEIVKHKTSKL
jgi:hypothetical protein